MSGQGNKQADADMNEAWNIFMERQNKLNLENVRVSCYAVSLLSEVRH